MTASKEPPKRIKADVNVTGLPNAGQGVPPTAANPLGMSDTAIQIATLRGELERLRVEWDSGHRALIERVAELEAWHTWFSRLVLALVITAIVGIVVAGATIGVQFGTTP